MTIRTLLLVGFVFLFSMAVIGCTQSKSNSSDNKQTSNKKSTSFDYEAVRESYKQNCSTCHGVKGDGNGVAAQAMTIKPRNFVKANFKYGSTEDDIFETITKGVPGTPMPPWKSLPESNRRNLAKFVLMFSKK